ncbi:MAG: HEAT repeat domain-containing protein [Pseudomonadota bacterium]
MSIEDEKLLVDFLTGDYKLEEPEKRRISSLIITSPKSASRSLFEAAQKNEDYSEKIENLSSQIAGLLTVIIALFEDVGKIWHQHIDEFKDLIINFDLKYHPILFREGLDDINDGEFVKEIASNLSDTEITKILVQSIVGEDSHDDIRSLTLFLASTIEKRKQLYPILIKELKASGISGEALSRITDDPLWSELSFSDKTTLLLKDDVSGFGDIDEVRSVLKELLSQKEVEKADVIINKVIALLVSTNPHIRITAIQALSEALDLFQYYDIPEGTITRIINLVTDRLEDPDREVRFLALEVVENHGTNYALDYLMRMLKKKGMFSKTEDDEIRKKAIMVVGRLGKPDMVIPELSKLVKAKSFLTVLENTDIRICAVKALAKIGTEAARDILTVVAKNDSREIVRKEAQKGLESIEEEIW